MTAPEHLEGLYTLPESSSSTTTRNLGFLMALVAYVVPLSFWAASQHAAAIFGHQEGLGTPLHTPNPEHYFYWVTGAIGTAVLFAWTFATPAYRAARVALAPAIAILAVGADQPLWSPLLFLDAVRRVEGTEVESVIDPALYTLLFVAAGALVLVITTFWSPRTKGSKGPQGDVHGSAHWADPDEISAAGLSVLPGGAVVGAIANGARVKTLHDARDRHTLVVAPPGAGKSSGWFIPTLLSCPDNAIVWDIKGELYRATAAYREEVLGHQILRFDPTSESEEYTRYNPLLLVDPRNDLGDATSLAEILSNPDGGEDSPGSLFWIQSSRALLTAVLLHVLWTEKGKTLHRCRELLSPKDGTVEHELARMALTPRPSGFENDERKVLEAPHEFVRQTANELLGLPSETRAGIVGSARNYLRLYANPRVATNTSRLDFEPRTLVTEPATLYLTISPADFTTLRPLIRVFFQQMASYLTRDGYVDPEKRMRLRLILDEFPTLGRLDFFERQLAYLRGYNILAYLACQSITQIKQTYGAHESIRDNCGVFVVAGATNDLPTAEELSKMAGNRTYRYAQESRSGVRGVLGPGRKNISPRDLARPLLTPDEARRLPPDRTVIFPAGHAPILGTKQLYFKTPHYLDRVGEHAPLFGSSAVTSPWLLLPAVPPPDPSDIAAYVKSFRKEPSRPARQPKPRADLSSPRTQPAAPEPPEEHEDLEPELEFGPQPALEGSGP